MRSKDEQDLRSILDQLIDKKQWHHGMEKASVEDTWRDLMGDAVNKRTESVYYNQGRLFVKLRSPSLKQQLFYSKETIQKRINETLGKSVVEEVVFT